LVIIWVRSWVRIWVGIWQTILVRIWVMTWVRIWVRVWDYSTSGVNARVSFKCNGSGLVVRVRF
jgi:hypothetical protein